MKPSRQLFVGGVITFASLLLPILAGAQEIDVSAKSLIFPLIGPQISSGFGYRIHPLYRSMRHHDGVDLAVPAGSKVLAVSGGTVIFASRLGGYGKLVSIKHPGGYTSLYGHLKTILVAVGQKVPAGALIGRVGSTGATTGPHLHFEWRILGKPLDPLKVFPAIGAAAQG